MKFCMVTTFFPPFHFGGDATFVRRLSAELGRRGHQVDVVHDVDAYRLLNGGEPAEPLPPSANVAVRRLTSRFGPLSPLATHQTGLPLFKARLRRLLESGNYDVIHYHNASLIGPGAFRWGDAVKLCTIHEQWLLCPLSLLWKYDSRICDGPQCIRCCIHAGRPPQLWRATGLLKRSLRHIDRFLAPSRFVVDIHREWGLNLPAAVLPLFVTGADEPAERPATPPPSAAPPHPKPYFLFVGRLVKPKGVHTLLGAFRDRPDADLLIAGDGDQTRPLRAAAAGLPNVIFLGHQPNERVRVLCRHAIALVVPSVCYEVFPTVALEAFAEGTPVIARDLGGIAEMVRQADAGVLFKDDSELRAALDRLQIDPERRRTLGRNGRGASRQRWTADAHMRRYLDIVDTCIAARARAGAAR
jgi:glycosyltransferase involved in cell wall biosynthesis